MLGIKQVRDSLDSSSIRSFLTSLYHAVGPGRKPYSPVSMLKAQVLNLLYLSGRVQGLGGR